MDALAKRPFLTAFIVFICVNILSSALLPDTKCSDGWASKSIGLSGACSHHGGVDRTLQSFVALLSLSLAVYVYMKLKRYSNQVDEKQGFRQDENDNDW